MTAPFSVRVPNCSITWEMFIRTPCACLVNTMLSTLVLTMECSDANCYSRTKKNYEVPMATATNLHEQTSTVTDCDVGVIRRCAVCE